VSLPIQRDPKPVFPPGRIILEGESESCGPEPSVADIALAKREALLTRYNVAVNRRLDKLFRKVFKQLLKSFVGGMPKCSARVGYIDSYRNYFPHVCDRLSDLGLPFQTTRDLVDSGSGQPYIIYIHASQMTAWLGTDISKQYLAQLGIKI
jgi:hypothetical protein